MKYLQRCLAVFLMMAPIAAVGANPTTAPGPQRRAHIESFVDQPDRWFESAEGKSVVDNIVGWQNANGGWFKNYNPRRARPTALADDPKSGPAGDDDSVWHRVSTFDNNATYSEMRILGRAVRVLKRPADEQAFERGLDYIFLAQYPNGGWPQRFPLQDNYGRRITFNDDAMTGVVWLLKDAAEGKGDFTFLDESRRGECRAAFERGVRCILDCQYRRDGVLTGWCQQHDENTLAPAGGRAYELPSLTANETSAIVRLLMEIDHPDARVRQSIDAAVAWLQSSKISGKRVKIVADPNLPGVRDRVVVDDAAAPAIWARFYDVQTNQPFFADRDGKRRAALSEVSRERRGGYAWYGAWPEAVLKAYPGWKARQSSGN